VLEDGIAGGVLQVEEGLIVALEMAGDIDPEAPFITAGYCDVHVHGWGGYDAMGGPAALDGMARALARRGVTSFLPTAVTAPLDDLARFADSVRDWSPRSPDDGSQPLGFNLEGPFLADSRRGAHDPALLRTPADVPRSEIEPLVDELRVITIAPELRGALESIAWLCERGVVVSLGHSAATMPEARAGYAAGATSTTHLFNAMTGIDHRTPGLAAAALLDDAVYTELIADGNHVVAALWPLIARLKARDRLLLVSDAISLAGTGNGTGRIGGLDVEVRDGRATLTGTDTLAGSVIALDDAVRNLVANGTDLAHAVAAASRNPLTMLGITDRGSLAVGQRADLVELDRDLNVRRVMISGEWLSD
jgi:N-acetylglucosamine-6-phosphate deacetylase